MSHVNAPAYQNMIHAIPPIPSNQASVVLRSFALSQSQGRVTGMKKMRRNIVPIPRPVRTAIP
ncbi:MAG: hypothetical protein WCK88_00530 [bacterium]